jgi:hypothetical protein
MRSFKDIPKDVILYHIIPKWRFQNIYETLMYYQKKNHGDGIYKYYDMHSKFIKLFYEKIGHISDEKKKEWELHFECVLFCHLVF